MGLGMFNSKLKMSSCLNQMFYIVMVIFVEFIDLKVTSLLAIHVVLIPLFGCNYIVKPIYSFSAQIDFSVPFETTPVSI